MEVEEGFEESLEKLRQTFVSGKTRTAAWRRIQLEGLLKLLKEKEEEIFTALNQDLGKHRVESYRDEVGILIKSLNLALDCLTKWMAGKRAWVPLLALPSTAEIKPEPLGLVLIFSAWNFPITLSLEPMIGAISAGNAVVLKPSEVAPATAALLSKCIPLYLDKEAIKVIEGGPSVGQRLLDCRWEKIFFTGSARIGRLVMSAAAKHLTPVVLELGGKCPGVLDSLTKSSQLEVAANRITGAKWGSCYGQACVAIDYLLVEEKFADTAINALKKSVRSFYGENPRKSVAVAKIVNRNHFIRVKKLLQDPTLAACIVFGGSIDDEKMFIEPTILLDPPLESEIMTEEIFGPVLPIITLKNIQQSIEFIRSRPKPLAIYTFTNDEKLKRRFVEETSSGSVTFNDAIIQFALDTIPFGGVGQSGFGKYHGKFSFDLFSNDKAVVRRSFNDFSFRYPPWDAVKLSFIRAVYDFDYLRLLLLLLGLKRQ